MPHFVGLDVSLKEVAICAVDDSGAVVLRQTALTDPDAVMRVLSQADLSVSRVVHESGPLSIWLQRGLEKLGLPAVCIDARLANKALSGRLNKSDRSDAEGLAQLARTGWFTAVHVRSEDADRLRTLIGARDRLVRSRKDLEAYIRGALKTFGIRMRAIGRRDRRAGFREQLTAIGQRDPALGALADGFCAAHEALCLAAEDLEQELRQIARGNALVRRLMTVPGVGPLVALSFIATVDDPGRFRRTDSIGAFLGLTPRRHQSGEIDWSGRISRRGDPQMRALLYEAASSLVHRVKRTSPLRTWALALVERKGMKKATVATARKLAVLLLSMWRSGMKFEVPEAQGG